MPSAEQAYEDLERDRATRESEIRLIERYYNDATNESEKSMLARSLVLLTYAHLEGFTKFSLLTYAAVINGLKLPCNQAALPLVAATLNRVFVALRDVNQKEALFRDLSTDHDVHLQARHVRFIESYDEVMSRPVEIPDSAVDTGSNLNARMLKRALFQMGLNYPVIAEHQDTLNQLLGERNAIAHGDILKRPRPDAVMTYLETTFRVMLFIKQEIFTALSNGAFYRPASNDA